MDLCKEDPVQTINMCPLDTGCYVEREGLVRKPFNRASSWVAKVTPIDRP